VPVVVVGADQASFRLTMKSRAVTRGHGLLEGFLAYRRRIQADGLIPDTVRQGRILDIGCGSFPLFLHNTRFSERYGLDRLSPSEVGDSRLTLIKHDISNGSGLPFENEFFDVVTMLAVFEHIETVALRQSLLEIHRVLRPEGLYVMTTPARWAEGILKAMTNLGLVSSEELNEHKATYRPAEIQSLVADAGFDSTRIRQGTFELGMNLWAVAQKRSSTDPDRPRPYIDPSRSA